MSGNANAIALHIVSSARPRHHTRSTASKAQSCSGNPFLTLEADNKHQHAAHDNRRPRRAGAERSGTSSRRCRQTRRTPLSRRAPDTTVRHRPTSEAADTASRNAIFSASRDPAATSSPERAVLPRSPHPLQVSRITGEGRFRTV